MYKIPLPITFNTHKHHFQFLKRQIENWKANDWHEVQMEMKCIGENLLDFYTGNMDVKQICEECLFYFWHENINDYASFKKWLGTNEYRKIQSSDKSKWIIKEGMDMSRYLHIHPAKYCVQTHRIRAITLKTVLALEVQSITISKNMKENLNQVNCIRKNYLQLSPVKSLNHNKGILKIWKLFREN